MQKRGKSKEECEAAFLRSCGPAICTVSVPHGPLIKDMGRDMMATSSLSLCLSSFCLTHPNPPVYLSLLSIPPPSAALWHSFHLFSLSSLIYKGLSLVTDVNRWMFLSFSTKRLRCTLFIMSLDFNSSSLKWSIHV